MTDEEDGPVVKITLATIYTELLKVTAILGPVPDKVSDHEIRIRAIEKYLWIWIGAAGVLGGVGGYFINYLFTR